MRIKFTPHLVNMRTRYHVRDTQTGQRSGPMGYEEACRMSHALRTAHPDKESYIFVVSSLTGRAMSEVYTP